MRYERIPVDLFIKNRRKLETKLISDSITVLCSNDPMPRNGDQFYPYRQHSDLFYLTGIEQPDTYLVIHKTETQVYETLFISEPHPEKEMWDGRQLRANEATKISGVERVQWSEQLTSHLKKITKNVGAIYYNHNANPRFQSDVPYRDLRMLEYLKKQFGALQFIPVAPIMEKLRLVKEPEEIDIIRKACRITGHTFNNILSKIRPGMLEYEIEAEMIRTFIQSGAKGHAYEPIVASGISACTLHYVSNDQQCKNGDLVLMDFGCEYANYSSDCSRTIPVNGKYTKRQRQLYQAVLNVFYHVRSIMKPGLTLNDIQKNACTKWEEEHIKLGLYSLNDVKKQDPASPLFKRYFMHGVSHFMGLDVHDVGSKDIPLQEGMIVTCEPGIYIPEEQTGIRIENDILIGKDNYIDLMQDIPVTIEEIEAQIEHTR